MIVETKFIEKSAFTVVGMKEFIHFDPNVPNSENSIAQLWGVFHHRMRDIPGQVGYRSYGLVLQNPELGPGMPFEYTAAVEVNEVGDIPEGMTRMEVPEARYLVVTYRGVLDGIGSGFKYFWGEWLPNSSYEYDGGTRSGKYEFEYYDQRYTGPNEAASEIDLYFPVRKKDV